MRGPGGQVQRQRVPLDRRDDRRKVARGDLQGTELAFPQVAFDPQLGVDPAGVPALQVLHQPRNRPLFQRFEQKPDLARRQAIGVDPHPAPPR
jgi:hypothetical protein